MLKPLDGPTERIIRIVSFLTFEPVIWLAAIAYLAIHNPYAQTDFSICPLKWMGFHWCPGCGLGRSISFLLHGDLPSSIRTHILGIPALLVLLQRTLSVLYKAVSQKSIRLITT